MLLLFSVVTVAGAVASLTAGAAVALVAVRVTRPEFRRDSTPPIDHVEAKRFGRNLVVAMTPAFLNLRLDQLMLGAVYSSETLGIYAVAASIAALLAGLGWVTESIVFPRASSGQLHPGAVWRMGLVLAGVSFGLAVLAATFAAPLVRLVYGPEYSQAASPLQWLVFAAGISVISSFLSALLKAAGGTNLMFRAHLAGTVVTVLTLPLLMHKYGLGGAGFAALASASITATLMTSYYLRVARGSPRG